MRYKPQTKIGDKFSFSATIDDSYDVEILRLPLFVKPQSTTPKYWNNTKVLEDVEIYGYTLE